MKTISDLVGATLGPGGQPVLVERREWDMPPIVTKDGVTVFKSIGFDDPVEHCIMESARDASVKTADYAGDGTTTATVLSEAIVRNMNEYLAAHPKESSQRIVRHIEKLFKDEMAPFIEKAAVPADLSDPAGKELLRSVATLSANGDKELGDAVIKCFEVVGDEGNVTISGVSGVSKYEVEQIDGFAVAMGFEDSLAKYYPEYLTDKAQQRIVLDSPAFVVYHGQITDVQRIIMLMEKIGLAWQEQDFRYNVVLVATGFAESVLGQLAKNMVNPHTINVVPLLAPLSVLQTGQLGFLEDVCAFTGAKLLDPINNPIEQADIDVCGLNATRFECQRTRSTILGQPDEDAILERVDQLNAQVANAISILDKQLLEERIGKLTGGIAKLIVGASSNGELSEKRDRADDAVCAVRGAMKHGCLPGGGWTLIHLAGALACSHPNDAVVADVLYPALVEPFYKLMSNLGYSEDETHEVFEKIAGDTGVPYHVFDGITGQMVDAFQAGILDSVPAVMESLKNSISIASLLGTLGGASVFKRDSALELSEAKANNEYLRDTEQA